MFYLCSVAHERFQRPRLAFHGVTEIVQGVGAAAVAFALASVRNGTQPVPPQNVTGRDGKVMDM